MFYNQKLYLINTFNIRFYTIYWYIGCRSIYPNPKNHKLRTIINLFCLIFSLWSRNIHLLENSFSSLAPLEIFLRSVFPRFASFVSDSPIFVRFLLLFIYVSWSMTLWHGKCKTVNLCVLYINTRECEVRLFQRRVTLKHIRLEPKSRDTYIVGAILAPSWQILESFFFRLFDEIKFKRT